MEARRQTQWPLVLLLLVICFLALLAPAWIWQSSGPGDLISPAAEIANSPATLPTAPEPVVVRPAVVNEARSQSPTVGETLEHDHIPWPESPRMEAEPAPRVANRAATDSRLPVPERPLATRDDVDDSATPASPSADAPAKRPLLPERNPESDAASPSNAAENAPSEWPVPQSLKRDLQALALAPANAAWANATLSDLERLRGIPKLTSPEAPAVFALLRQRVAEAEPLAQSAEFARATAIRRGAYALERRLAVWQAAHAAAAEPDVVTRQHVDRPRLVYFSAAVRRYFAEVEQGNDWLRWLELDKLDSAVKASTATVDSIAKVARPMLSNLRGSGLDEYQQEILAAAPVQSLAQELRLYAVRTVDVATVLTQLEAYENEPSEISAAQLATACETLAWSPNVASRQTGDQLDSHFRNANVRIAVKEDFLNRMLPVMQTMYEEVNDEILGAPVSGTSEVSTRLRVRLVPDRLRLALGLEATGNIHSDTASYHGPVTFHNRGYSEYHARKLVLLDRLGLNAQRTSARASTSNDLTDVQSDYDHVPFLGSLVRAAARNQHDQKRGEAESEVQYRVSARASQRLDAAVQPKLEHMQRQFDERVVQPLRRLGVEPKATELQTTTERLIARYRIAGDAQLAAHTPRPLAPADSLVSVQLHESALNNTLEQLRLHGRRMTLPELFQEIGDTFELTKQSQADMPDDVTVEFAAEQPLRVRVAEGRLTLVLQLAELTQADERKWHNFTVHAHYTPELAERTPTLVRAGPIELVGEKLGFRDQVALRGVFSKVFDKKRPLPLVDPRFLADPRVADLAVSQLALEHGWIGVALRAQPTTAILPASRR